MRPSPPALVPLQTTRTDDPRVVREAENEDYSTHVVPLSWRIGRRSLSMSWYSVVSGMFYLVTAATLAAVVGTVDTIIGIVLASAVFGVIGFVVSRYAARTGLTVALLSQRLFGTSGSVIAALVLGATAIYYAVFEGSVIAHALATFFGVFDIRIWYAIAIAMNLPLVMRGIRRWMDKYNAVLLPVYAIGLVVAVVIAAQRSDASGWLAQLPVRTVTLGAPGWLYAFFVYLGVLVFVMYTIDFARLGKPQESRANGVLVFGPLFYVLVYLANGLIGIFLAYAAGIEGDGSSASIVTYIITIMGGWGLLLVWVTQARINTANYYVAATNVEALWARLFRRRLSRVYAVLICGLIAYLFMLTNVLDYLIVALAWQGAFIASWVGILLVHILLSRRDAGSLEFRPGRLGRFGPAAAVWLLVSVGGVVLYQFGGPIGATWSTPVVLVLGGVLYAAVYRAQSRSILLPRLTELREEVEDEWEDRVRCHLCDKSYIAVEMDRDPAVEGQPAICVACASIDRAYRRATLEEGKALRQRPASR